MTVNEKILKEQIEWLSGEISKNPFSETGIIFTTHAGQITGIKRVQNLKFKPMENAR